MNFCSNPHSLVFIDLNELIGKSLITINTNFSLLKEQICSQNNFLHDFEEKCRLIETKIFSLSAELNKTPFAYVNFTSNGNILKQKGISSVSRISLGTYRINFLTPHTNYILNASLVSSIYGFVNSVTETSTSITIRTRQQNNNLFDPEKISLIFFS